MASKAQIITIHALRRTLKLEDGEYYGMLESYGVKHSNELSFESAKALLDRLSKIAEACGKWKRNTTGKRHEHLADRVGDFATPKQLRMIEALWTEVTFVRGTDEQRKALRHFLDKHFRVSALQFLTQDKVGKVIRTLQAMKRQNAAKAAAGKVA